MTWKPGQSGNPNGRRRLTPADVYRDSLKRMMDRAILKRQAKVEEALAEAATSPKYVLPALELWGRVRGELGPGQVIVDARQIVAIQLVGESADGAHAHLELPANGVALRADDGTRESS